MELHYQPIVDLKQKIVSSFEALMRWHHPELGTISPGDFIPLAEQTGLIVEMGKWALRQACLDASNWPGQVKVTVNVSPAQFENDDLYEVVKGALDASGLEPRRLELEITERSCCAMKPGSTLLFTSCGSLASRSRWMTSARRTPLSAICAVPFDTIKIDRSFVRDLDDPQHPDCVAIINAVVALAKQLQMNTVAEGVETADHLRTVSMAGCEVQGFYFSKPVQASEVQAILAQISKRLASADHGTS